MAKRKPVKAKQPRELPKTKKDGTPLTPWSDRVNAYLAKREENREQGIPSRADKIRENGGVICKAHTSGLHGPKRPCENPAMLGQTVCRIHGGSTKASKAAARELFIDELAPTIRRLKEIRDQSVHYPSALGASTTLVNRALGKIGEAEGKKDDGRPIINIGVSLGGLPGVPKKTQVLLDVARPDDNTDEDFENEDYEGDDPIDTDDYETE